LFASRVLEDLVHASGLCCGWPARVPDKPGEWLQVAGYVLMNTAANIDNGWGHQWASFKVDDAFAKAKDPEFYDQARCWSQGGCEDDWPQHHRSTDGNSPSATSPYCRARALGEFAATDLCESASGLLPLAPGRCHLPVSNVVVFVQERRLEQRDWLG
jgi:hypothetical protein